MTTGITTLADIKAAKTTELVEFYNKLTGKEIKKFESREKAESRIWALIKEKSPKKIKSLRMNFRFMPRGEKEIVELRKNSLREKVFQLLIQPEGATFFQIQKEFNWSIQNTYEAIRLIHSRTGHGMWSTPMENGDIHISIIDDKQKYMNLKNDNKLAA